MQCWVTELEQGLGAGDDRVPGPHPFLLPVGWGCRAAQALCFHAVPFPPCRELGTALPEPPAVCCASSSRGFRRALSTWGGVAGGFQDRLACSLPRKAQSFSFLNDARGSRVVPGMPDLGVWPETGRALSCRVPWWQWGCPSWQRRKESRRRGCLTAWAVSHLFSPLSPCSL